MVNWNENVNVCVCRQNIKPMFINDGACVCVWMRMIVECCLPGEALLSAGKERGASEFVLGARCHQLRDDTASSSHLSERTRCPAAQTCRVHLDSSIPHTTCRWASEDSVDPSNTSPILSHGLNVYLHFIWQKIEQMRRYAVLRECDGIGKKQSWMNTGSSPKWTIQSNKILQKKTSRVTISIHIICHNMYI